MKPAARPRGAIMNPTNDPSLHSWVPVPPDSDFPIPHLPLGISRRRRPGAAARAGVAIGDSVLDLAVLEERGLFAGPALRQQSVFGRPALNAFFALGRPAWAEARAAASRLLRADEPALRGASLRAHVQVQMNEDDVLVQAMVLVISGDGSSHKRPNT